ncbi:MAG: chromosome segregation protein SMC [Armatimonadetes bacterium]|nr:chromosome segregation protein SMC [Armatimonadota bacterium]
MYLKRVELHGFKSFAAKTEIEFLPGVSAIVGPNGSGKSNIAEAIQWVLGERSYRALRSARSTDIIFAGSQKRKPMNIAEVTLVFDNSDGALPLGFNEVSITRRIYRSGECDYFINKTPCRLRDIQDLLLNVGLSADAFTLIGQNEVDAILAARPEDRRALFEQVAGIERYQVRRLEAMRKLEKTERNITRLKDIRHELEAQLGAIAEQAELARQYKELMERYRALQMGLLGWEWGIRQRRLQRLSEESEQWRERLQQVEGCISELERRRSEARVELQKLEEQLEQLRERSVRAVEMTKSLEGEIELTKQQQHHISERIEAEQSELQRALERQQALLNRLSDVREKMAELCRSVNECEHEQGEVLKELERIEAEVAAREAEVESLRSKHVEAMRAVTSLRNRLIDYAHTETALRLRLSELERERAELGEQAEALKVKMDEIDSESNAVRHKRADIQERLRTERLKLSELERFKDELRYKVATLRELLSGLRARLSALEENEATLQGIREGPKSVLMASRAGKLSANYQLVAHLLCVPGELEIAIATALGSAIEYIVTETAEGARAAINYLKQSRSGRATFLSLDFIRPNLRRSEDIERLIGEHSDGIIGWANELVEIADSYEAVREYLLGNVLVVRDMTVATDLGRRLISGIRIVTLDGELIIPGGPISGGHEAHSLHMLFARRREIEELRNRIRDIEARLQRCEAELREKSSEFERRKNTAEALIGELSELAELEARLDAEREALGRRSEQLNARLELLDMEQKQIEGEHERIINEVESCKSELREAENYAGRIEHDISEALRRMDELLKARDELRSRLSDVRMRLARLSEKLNSAQSEEEEIHKLLEETEQRALRCRQIMVTLNAQLNELSLRLHRLEEEHKQLWRSRDEAESAFELWRKYRSELLSELDLVSAELRRLSEEKDSIESELNRIEVRKAETRSEGDELARRLVEEFCVTPQEALQCAEGLQHKQAAVEELNELKRKIEQMGTVNVGVIEEYERLSSRIEYLKEQERDLEGAREDLHTIIRQIDDETRSHLIKTVMAVEREFQALFSKVFDGGEVHLALTDTEDITRAGVEVRVRPPGKAMQDLLVLSGGERAMTAICLLFAMLSVRPVPFCMLDEVDAALDDTNVSKFAGLLKEFSRRSQFIIITHNQGTLEVVDRIYGVTMDDDGVSRMLSLSLEEAASSVAG